MGLGKREDGKFITILRGKFCERVQAGTPESIERVNKIGNTVHELFHDNFTGKLIDIKTRDGEYGKTWNFHFKDKEDVYILQLSYSNSFSTAFLKMLPNIDLTKEMKVSPSVKEVDGKKKSSLFVNQDDTAIKHAYTMAEPNGMPDMEQITVKGEKVWDDTKRMEFLEAMVQKDIMPKLTEAGNVNPIATATETPTPATPNVAEDEINPEDIPF